MLCTTVLAEAITVQFASNPSLFDSSNEDEECVSFPLTEAQEQLKVSRALVCLAALCTNNEGKRNHAPFSKNQDLLFQKLQKLYQETLNIESPLFVLSPTLLPCPEAQEWISLKVQTLIKQLEEQSNTVANSLLDESLTNQTKVKKQRKLNKQRARQTALEGAREDVNYSSEDSSDTSENEEDADDDNSSVQVLSSISVPNENDYGIDDGSGDSWIQVKRKRSSSFKGEDCVDVNENDKSGTATNDNTSSADTQLVKDIITEDITSEINPSNENDKEHEQYDGQDENDMQTDSSNGTKTKQSLQYISVKETLAATELFDPGHGNDTHKTASESTLSLTDTKHHDTALSTAHNTANTTGTIESLQKEIHQLKVLVKAKEAQIQRERQSHAKAMKTEQDLMEERMQALQLRLYISETRSRTFEEALQQHVAAVSSNVSMTPSKRVTQDESPSNKPLYSRAETSTTDD